MKKIFAIIISVLALASCTVKTANKEDQLKKLKSERDKLNEQIALLQLAVDSGKTVVKTVPVSLETLEPTLFRNFIEVQGHVDAQDNVNVNAELSGVVTFVNVVPGQKVYKGQVLAQLDDNVVRQQIAQLQTQADFMKSLYDKQKNLWSQQIGTQVQLLQAKNNYENVLKQIAVQKSQLDMYQLTSPINGTVDEVDLKVGQAVTPGMSTIRVVNLDDLRAKGQIAEAYSSHVHAGDNVDVIFPDANDTLHTKLTFVASVIDPNSRSFNVEIKLPSHSIFRPNMVAVIKVISYKNNHAIVVPIDVIQHSEEGDYVYISKNNKAEKAMVIPGQSYNGQSEILSGLKPGDKLIIDGFQDLDDGDSLQVAE
jgi:membrane fusion protein, multidrug efflux system